jgi:FkbM family methyltransferase
MNKLLQIPKNNLGNYIIPKDVVGGLAVDIGSNVGSFLKQSYHIFSEIYYYEPIKACFDICQDFSQNHSHIHGYNNAVSKTRGLCTMLMHENRLAGSSAASCLGEEIISLEHNSDNNIINDVYSITLQDIYSHVNLRNIDYCKCDCEISEYDIFMNQDLTPINYLAIEMHWQMGEQKFNELIDYILTTHDLIYGNKSFPGRFDNRELLLKRKVT